MAPEFKLKVSLGVDFRNRAQQQFILLAENNMGFQRINEYLSLFLMEGRKIPAKAEAIEYSFVIYPFQGQTYRPLQEE